MNRSAGAQKYGQPVVVDPDPGAAGTTAAAQGVRPTGLPIEVTEESVSRGPVLAKYPITFGSPI